MGRPSSLVSRGSRLQKELIGVAPGPVFAPFVTADDRVPGTVEVVRCMLPGRAVATSDVAAGQAHTEVHPAAPRLKALRAPFRWMRLNGAELINVCTAGGHRILLIVARSENS
jgi:hypothetical protein